MNLTGRYMGDNGDLWALKATVELLGSHAKGRMHWTLVECPPELPWAKHVGRSGYEFVEGSWDQDCMNLTGLKVSDTDATFLTLAHYNLVFDSGFRTFEGTARAISNTEYKKWGVRQITRHSDAIHVGRRAAVKSRMLEALGL